MNITIDTEKKEIIINEDILIEDFLNFLDNNNFIEDDYIIKKEVKTVDDWIFKYPWIYTPNTYKKDTTNPYQINF